MITVYEKNNECMILYKNVYIMIEKSKETDKNTISIFGVTTYGIDFLMPPILHKLIKEKFPDVIEKLENMDLSAEKKLLLLNENHPEYENYKFIIDIHNFIMCK